MSFTRTIFNDGSIEPLTHLDDVDNARNAFRAIVDSQNPLIDERNIKAADVGVFVANRLLELGQMPNHPPLISDARPDEMDTFLHAFGVNRLCDLEKSLPVHLSNCEVVIDEVMKWSELTPREREELPEMHDSLPAVRVNFIPSIA